MSWWRRRKDEDPIAHLDFEPGTVHKIDLSKEALYITLVKCKVCGAVILIRFGPTAIDGTPEHKQYHIDRGETLAELLVIPIIRMILPVPMTWPHYRRRDMDTATRLGHRGRVPGR